MEQPPPMEPNQPQPKKGLSTGCIVGIVLGVIGLVIVAVIGIAAAIMFPAAKKVQNKALEARGLNDAHNLKSAVSSYYVEYRKYPAATPAASGDTELQSDAVLMDVLLASSSAATTGGLNSRGIVFFSGRKASPAAGGTFKNGVELGPGGGGKLWDPFGNHFRVLLDTDYDNIIKSPEPGGAAVSAGVLIWSAGPDGDFNTWDDNLKTW